MKPSKHLYERIHDIENLYTAFYKAARRKRGKPDVLLYRKNLDANLRTLQRQLRTEQVETGQYNYFTIHEPKERLICAASFSERVLHHGIMNVLEPELERFQIHDSYACRTGKGTEAALQRALYFARRNTNFLKLDIRKYFDSIPHTRLLELLRRRISDPKLLNLLRQILSSYEHTSGRGVPIGNLTSQHLANFYLAHVDHLVKDRLRIPGYARYMDDMLLFSSSVQELRDALYRVREFITSELDLAIKPLVTGLCGQGVPFLGFLVKPDGIFLSRVKRSRARQRVAEYYRWLESQEWTQEEFAAHILPVFAHLSIARSRRFRHNLVRKRDLRLEPGETLLVGHSVSCSQMPPRR